jgi:endonuclease YncB( thermonuclease family)
MADRPLPWPSAPLIDPLDRLVARATGSKGDSPETGDAAACAAEDALGQKTEARARELFEAGRKVTFLPEGQDRYGRLRAHVYLDGDHVGWLLSRDGLARPQEEGGQVDWCG